MKEKILFVDDDPNILSALKRQLFKRFHVDTALGGGAGLEAIASQGPYAVIVADMRMPGMDGIQFLSKAKERTPDSTRMMLTGNADQQTAIDAINEGNIFRFLTKPCMPEKLTKAITDGIAQYRLVTIEKELLEKTLNSSVKVLTDVLTLVNHAAFGRASRARRMVRIICNDLKVEKSWQIEIAAMLSQLGCITMPDEILEKVYKGAYLTEKEQHVFQSHPQTGAGLIANIPRLEDVAMIITYQEKRFDGTGAPHDSKCRKDIPLGSRILKLALDYDALITSGITHAEALTVITERKAWYDPEVLDSLERATANEIRKDIVSVKATQLTDGMVLAEDIESVSGILVAAKGLEVTPIMIARLFYLAHKKKINEPIKVFIPIITDASAG